MSGDDEVKHPSGDGINWRGPAKDVEALSRLACELIVEEIRRKSDLLWCAASGSSPIRCYELLAEKRQAEPRLFDRLRILKLDEWGGLPMDDPATCEAYLRHYLIEPLGISENRYFTFQSNPPDAQLECQRIRDLLAEHSPIDLCLLGLGVNGHLGLNEPADSLQAFTHIAQLSESSRQHSMLGKATRPPKYGITLGMREILAARKIVLLVSGANKKEPLGRLRAPQISTAFPASLLWLHRDVTCLYDREAVQDW
ncbi:MAG: putative deaminase/isomerase [Blastocatellia bacterium]